MAAQGLASEGTAARLESSVAVVECFGRETGGLAAAAAIVPAGDLAQSGNDAGHGVFECDQPSTTFGQFGDERVTAAARGLDVALERLARAAE